MVPAHIASCFTLRVSLKTHTESPSCVSGMSVTSSMHMSIQTLPIMGAGLPCTNMCPTPLPMRRGKPSAYPKHTVAMRLSRCKMPLRLYPTVSCWGTCLICAMVVFNRPTVSSCNCVLLSTPYKPKPKRTISKCHCG